eukprot:6211739-Pleurochrysis_carterae.AAC.1
MPPPPPRSTRSPCRSAARSCASGLGKSRGAERCGRRCRSRRPRGRSRARLEKQRLQLQHVGRPCSWARRAQGQSCLGACAS